MMRFEIQKVGNMVFLVALVADENVIFKAWDEYSFTERKLENAKKWISAELNGNVTVKDVR